MKQSNDRLTKKFRQAGETLYRRVFSKVLPVKAHTKQMLLLNGEESPEAHYGAKIMGALAVFAAGSLLIVFGGLGRAEEETYTEMPRAEYGGGTAYERLQAQTAEGVTIGEYDVVVEARRYTQEETEALFAQAFDKLPQLIAADNDSLQAVTGKLYLPETLPGFPFRADYTSSDYARLRTDGTVQNRDLEKPVRITLTVGLTYERDRRTRDYALTILPAVLSAEEEQRTQVGRALQGAQEESVHAPSMTLPTEAGGESIIWKSAPEDRRMLLFLLTIVASALVFFAPDRTLQKNMRRRQEALQTAYPGFVSRLSLYLGAGMTLRAAFFRMADTETSCAVLKGELQLVAGWLTNGVPERTAFERFSNRTGLSQYTKLTALLTQNLEKGTALIPLIRAEAAAQSAARLDAARVRGEQTATRLMLPMMLMLGVVMVLIMVPAFLSF
ncbi:MAG: type II secretion system F family protein [Lachnospiraceae bacterium]|nr:type II secretion system F family protein [Lachnospiraceae bacterium]